MTVRHPTRPRPAPSGRGSGRALVVSASVGGGHDGAAHELARRLRGAGCRVDLVDALDLLPGRLGHLVCRLYRHQLTVAPRSWGCLLAVLDTRQGTALARGVARLVNRRLQAILDDDVILAVSTHPLATHALAHARARGHLHAPLVVQLTDPSVHRVSISRAATLTVAPTDVAARQARRLGAERVAVVPPLVAPAFRPAHGPIERERLRAALHLPIRLRLALVVSGSWGVGEVEETVADIAGTGLATPVVVCGRNEALRARLVAAGHHHVLGWVDDMAALIRACDIVVQNAGGLTAAEALVSAVPALSYRCLPGHGRTNAAALDADGLVPWIRSRDDLVRALTCAGARGPTVWAQPESRPFDDTFAEVFPGMSEAEVHAAC
jgi:UDP-N-acetylglucosamine:LPS N-acetylglucosamine transferase